MEPKINPAKINLESLHEKTLKELFQLSNEIGGRRYNRLTQQDFADYRKFDYWRYHSGDYECGTTAESKAWVTAHSDRHCPVCEGLFSKRDGKTIDHKLPRSQYPWLSMTMTNLWVICRECNIEKAEMHWYQYEHYIFVTHPDRYENVRLARPRILLKTLSADAD
jgi:5-methylcytosine-specific restriction endonuclease McrA